MIGEPLDSLLKQPHIEIDEQSDPQVAQSQVGNQLLAVYREKRFHGFQFNYDGFVDDEIGAKCIGYFQLIVIDCDWHLTLNFESSPDEFVGEDGFINGLQEPWARAPMNRESRIDDYCSEIVGFHEKWRRNPMKREECA